MESALLSTKLKPPEMRSDAVSRPRLSALFDRILGRRLTLVSAPAGYGKTTLVAGWVQILQHRDIPVAWVSLDQADNEPGRFWTYVATAVSGPIQPPIESVLTTLINGLASLWPPNWSS